MRLDAQDLDCMPLDYFVILCLIETKNLPRIYSWHFIYLNIDYEQLLIEAYRPYEVGNIITPVLQMRTLRPREGCITGPRPAASLDSEFRQTRSFPPRQGWPCRPSPVCSSAGPHPAENGCIRTPTIIINFPPASVPVLVQVALLCASFIVKIRF